MQQTATLNIEYIHANFLRIGDRVRNMISMDEVIRYIESEPEKYKSIAYESAAVELAHRDILQGNDLNSWQLLYDLKGCQHPVHLQIGLGWAFAKAGVIPETYPYEIPSGIVPMVYNGVGYYYGLFKGRSTLKQQLMPDWVRDEKRNWFDNGLGRRLWYYSKGVPGVLSDTIGSFISERHPHLWLGAGIACGYVGGSTSDQLEHLVVLSGSHRAALSKGVSLAAQSRAVSESVNDDILLASEIVCAEKFGNRIANTVHTGIGMFV